MSGVYLSLAQGVTEPKSNHGSKRLIEYLKNIAKDLRNNYSILSENDFLLDDNINLKTNTAIGLDDEYSCSSRCFESKGGIKFYRDLISSALIE